MPLFLALVWAFLPVLVASVQPSTYTVPGAFPTSVFKTYYNDATATSAQVQPVVSDPVTHKVFPFSLTDPNRIPLNNTKDPQPLPPPASSSKLFFAAVAQLQSISASAAFSQSSCARCQAILEVAKFVSLATPANGPAFFIEICNVLKLSSTCNATYSRLALGAVLTQVVAEADVGGYDGQGICQNFFKGMCPAVPTLPLNMTGWFKKPKPSPLPTPKKPSGKRLNVLHISDVHLDPRYGTGSEANCTSGTCCRSNKHNDQSPGSVLFPAPRFGAFRCDSPLALTLSALESIPKLAGINGTGFDWAVYTGDLVAHDDDSQLSRDYVEYTEDIMYGLFKRMLGGGPVYATLGNHDTYNQAEDAPHSIGGELAKQYSWNYDHLAALWEYEKWLPHDAATMARSHYSAYSVKRYDGLKVISLNTDMWYKANHYMYINMTNPDVSGMLRFVTDELQASEDAGERVWIIGHVLTGWDGTNPLPNPTNLFYQIVDRYSPHVISTILFGHTHEDQFNIFYTNNATTISVDKAVVNSWMGPSITPNNGLNSGFRVYEVDSATFEIMDAHTWSSDVNSYPALDSQTALGPAYAYEYNTRETYGRTITDWKANDPLNATWWHRVTEAMEADPNLVASFTTYQGKSSVRTKPCTGDCITAKICYMRSGSATIGLSCKQGYGSVQG